MLSTAIAGKTSTLTDSRLSKFFIDQLCCMYNGERSLLVQVSIMQEAANMVELKALFGEYLLQVDNQRIRLEEIFKMLLVKHGDEPCDAMEGIVKEITRIIEKTPEGTMTRDAALIIAAQKAGHYKIATYGSLSQLATSMGMEDVSTMLLLSLQDEKDNDILFSDIADRRVNWLAETE